MPNPEPFLDHLRAKGYHPRSDKHSNVLAACVVSDLVRHCPAIRRKAEEGDLVYSLNFPLLTGTAEWNVDLVLGRPAMGSDVKPEAGAIARAVPSTVQVAIEFKAVMTEHRKAVKNRKRDFESHHDHVHRYDDRAIAGGLLVVNASPTFKSPLRPSATVHRQPIRLVTHCVSEMRAVAVRSRPGDVGLEAKGVVVVSLDPAEPGGATFLTTPPAPPVGDPMQYDAFIQTLCSRFIERYS